MLTIIDLPKKFCIARKVPKGRPIKLAIKRATNVTRIDKKSISYKSLSTKDRDLYFPTNVNTEEEHDNILEQQMADENNRYMARQELGENMTGEQYNEWMQNRRINQAEDKLAYDERDILSDDDE